MKFMFFFGILVFFGSCACKPLLTDEHVSKNQQNIAEVMQFMNANHIDTLLKKECDRSIKKKLRKLKTPLVVCFKSYSIYDYHNTIKEKNTFFEFTHVGPILGYSELLLMIPPKTKDSLKNALLKTHSKINDTIYHKIWPTLPLM